MRLFAFSQNDDFKGSKFFFRGDCNAFSEGKQFLKIYWKVCPFSLKAKKVLLFY